MAEGGRGLRSSAYAFIDGRARKMGAIKSSRWSLEAFYTRSDALNMLFTVRNLRDQVETQSGSSRFYVSRTCQNLLIPN